MSRKELSLPIEHIRAFDLERLRENAADLNRRHLEAYTTPFPKAPSRWLSHYQFEPRAIELTPDGEVEGEDELAHGLGVRLWFHAGCLRSLLLPGRGQLLRPGQPLRAGVGRQGRRLPRLR